METADHITPILKEQNRHGSIHDDFVNDLLANLEPDEEVLWSVIYSNMEKKFGPVAMLTVTNERLISQESGWMGKNSLGGISMDDVLAAVDEPHKVLFGLTTNHYLHVVTTSGRLVWKDLPDESVGAAAAAIRSVKAAALA
jgi:hypothetical protein